VMLTIIIIPDRSSNPVPFDCLTLSDCALLATSDVVAGREGDFKSLYRTRAGLDPRNLAEGPVGARPIPPYDFSGQTADCKLNSRGPLLLVIKTKRLTFGRWGEDDR
jgi:hypothetical protein